MGLVIIAVMVKVVLEGVHLQERPLVKWSEDQGATLVGGRLADFLFARIQDQKDLCLLGDDPWFEEFQKSFVHGLRSHGIDKPVYRETESDKSSQCWSVRFERIDETSGDACAEGNSQACLAKRVLRKIKKEQADSGQPLFSLFQTGPTSTVLFYFKKLSSS